MPRSFSVLFNRPSFHEPVVDGVRALAIIWVLIFHTFFFHLGTYPSLVGETFKGTFTSWIGYGTLGVDMFFVISGYLIGTILLKELADTGRIDLRRFYGRRFLRLMPVYIVAMLLGVYFLRNIPATCMLMKFPPSGNLENAWANLLYVNNFLTFSDQYMIWTWSLAIEEQFYLIAPLFLLLVVGQSKRPISWMVVLLILSGFIRLAVVLHHGYVAPINFSPADESWSLFLDRFYTKLHVRYAGLLAGLLGAHLSFNHRAAVDRFFSHPRRTTLLAAAGLLAALWCATATATTLVEANAPKLALQLFLSHPRDIFSVAVLLIILIAIHGQGYLAGALQRTLSNPWLFPISQISYSLYLVHEMIMMWLFPKTAPWLAGSLGLSPIAVVCLNGLVATGLSVGISAFLYVNVERPSMELRRSRWFRRLFAPSELQYATQTR